MWLLSITNRKSYMGFRLDLTLNDLKGKFKEGVEGWIMFSKVVLTAVIKHCVWVHGPLVFS